VHTHCEEEQGANTHCHGLRGQEAEGKQEQRTDLQEAARSAALSTVAHCAGAAILPPPAPAPPAPAPPATTTPLPATPLPAMAPATPATPATPAPAETSPTPTQHLPIYPISPDTFYTETYTGSDTDTETHLSPTTEIAQAHSHSFTSPCPTPLTPDSPAAASLHTNTLYPTIVPILASHPPPPTQIPIRTSHPTTSVNTLLGANTPHAHIPTLASNSERSSLWQIHSEFSSALTFENVCLGANPAHEHTDLPTYLNSLDLLPSGGC